MADPGLVIEGGPWERFREGEPSPTARGGLGGSLGGQEPPKFFSLDMLLETHLVVNNYAKYTQIGDNVGWTMVQKCGEQ